MAGSGNRADPRREQLAFGKWFQSARFHIGLQRSAIALEHRLEEFGGLAFVLGVEPVVEVLLVDPYDGIGKRKLSLGGDVADVICMEVCQIDLVDLLRFVFPNESSGAEVPSHKLADHRKDGSRRSCGGNL